MTSRAAQFWHILGWIALLIVGGVRPGSAQTVVVNWGGDYVTFDNNLRGYITDEYPVNLDGGFNDARSYCTYSETSPLSPPTEYGGPSARFYGGVLLLKYNGRFLQRWAEIWSGSSISPNDKLYYGADTYALANDQNTVGYDFRFWKKEDFVNGGAKSLITLGPTSKLEILDYEGGGGDPTNNWGNVRFVVRDGTQFYISEDFGAPGTTTISFTLSDLPNRRWAPYNPYGPYNIQFDWASAVFAPHTFGDITAFGYYHSNDNSTDLRRKAGFTAARFRVTADVGGTVSGLPSPPQNLRIVATGR